MSSKRGRKRNDNLPPNRARDVQRAFRARRAAHLLALEERVAELEDENNTLRAALSLPPANRPPLGKGPTGKDKPKSLSRAPPVISTEPIASTSALPVPGLPLVAAARTDSPSSASTRTHSLSPSSIAAVLNPPGAQPVVSVETSWQDGLFATRDHQDVQPSPMSTSYPVTPVSAASPVQFPFTAAGPSASRPAQFPMSLAQNFPHTADRPMDGQAASYADALFTRRFSFSQPAFPDASAGPRALHAHSPTVSVPNISPQRGSAASMQPQSAYAHRRSITEPQNLCNVLLGDAQQMQYTHALGKGPTE
ncbi:hypothetical protein EIP86_007123 [Pleurotus ostreatoroseus]|nr:hypothetical protein EIP86_007123 [Pleurotus ostreatoroseus]